MSDRRVLNLLSQITDAVALVASHCEADEQAVQDAVAKSFLELEIPEITEPAADPFPISHRNLLGRMLSYWRTLLAYVDDEGSPLPLPETGPEPSMETLFKDAVRGDKSDLSDIDAERATQLLFEHDSMAKDEQDRFFPIAYAFRVNTSSRAGAIANLAYLAEYACTIRHNAYGGQGGRFLAVARVQGIPAEQLPRVSAMLYDQGYPFLMNVDSFIENLKEKGGQASELRDIGIGMYLLDAPHKPDVGS